MGLESRRREVSMPRREIPRRAPEASTPSAPSGASEGLGSRETQEISTETLAPPDSEMADAPEPNLLTERYVPSEKQPNELLSEIQNTFDSKRIIVEERIGDPDAVSEVISRWSEQSSDTDPENERRAEIMKERLAQLNETVGSGSAMALQETDGEIANALFSDMQQRVQETLRNESGDISTEVKLAVSELSREASTALAKAHEKGAASTRKTADMLERIAEIDRLLEGGEVVEEPPKARDPFRDRGESGPYSISAEELQARGAVEEGPMTPEESKARAESDLREKELDRLIERVNKGEVQLPTREEFEENMRIINKEGRGPVELTDEEEQILDEALARTKIPD